MKKIFTLALALVMVLGLAAPALAYTTNVGLQAGVSPYTVDIYLVDHVSTDFLSGWIQMPATDRGYTKNEVIAAVGVLNVPANYDVFVDAYRQVRFNGTNVTLDVVDNLIRTGTRVDYFLAHNVPDVTGGNANQWNTTAANVLTPWALVGASLNSMRHNLLAPAGGFSFIPVVGSARTYKWLCFGKVTDDDAKMSFVLSRNAVFRPIATPFNLNYAIPATNYAAPVDFLVLSEDFVVARTVRAAIGANVYYVYENTPAGFDFDNNDTPGELRFIIETGTRGRSERLYMFPNGIGGIGYHVFVEPSTQELVFAVTGLGNGARGTLRVADQIRISTYNYTTLRAMYDAIFEGQLGFTAYNLFNLLNESDWHSLAASVWDISESVDVEPWTPYVSVPENIVVDPPKTGDASIVGFVMIALAAAAAVVVRKVRA